MNVLNAIVLILMIVGALNWGLVGLFNLDLVERIFHGLPAVSRVLFIIVGLAGIYAIVFFNMFYHHIQHERHEGTPHPQ
jgi:uncharacterized membrane protein YuzA (DUF378 family)